MVREINSVTCTTWVPQGAAKRNPERVSVEAEVLKGIIEETKDKEDFGEDEIADKEYETLEIKALEEDLKLITAKKENEVENMNQESTNVDEEKCLSKLYNLDTYEHDPEETLLRLGKLTVHAVSEDDPYITIKEEDEESEIGNHEILPTDNLITVGHVDGESFILEVYVYNSEEGSLYVHHDTLLPSVPYCMEWLDFDPEDEQLSPGNLLAIGYHSPVIEFWDLNILDTIEPAFTLGTKAKKKKKSSEHGHSDSVLCLGWNKELSHIFASGSVDKTVKLWDMQVCKVAQNIDCFGSIVSDLKWNVTGKQLITACGDKKLRLHNFNSDSIKSWELDGEVECISWGNCQQTNNVYACTDVGTLYGIDIRQSTPLFKTNAHSKSCTGLLTSPSCPGCLVTASDDETVKIWDVLNNEAKLIEERNFKVGIIHSLSICPNLPFVLCLGGSNKENNFKVWDMRQSVKVRRRFCERVGLPTDSEIPEEADNEPFVPDEDLMEYESEFGKLISAVEGSTSKGAEWKPTKKSKKKKGGHLDKKKGQR